MTVDFMLYISLQKFIEIYAYVLINFRFTVAV